MQFKEFTLTLIKNEEKILEENFTNLATNNSLKINLLDYNTILDIEKEKFIRENKDFIFNLDIKEKNCTITLKKENIVLPIQVEFCELTVSSTKIVLEYLIESEDSKNKIIIKKVI